MQQYSANGKLLLSGEYVVLDGARALAVPTKYGQQLNVASNETNGRLHWQSFTREGICWIDSSIDLHDNNKSTITIGSQAILDRLLQLINAAVAINSQAAEKLNGKKVTTQLEFPSNWGLGSSSTLVWMLSQWLKVDPFELLAKTFGGSGYDLACAGSNNPIVYWRDEHKKAHWQQLDWHPSWAKQTFFVYLNQKQNSREGIKMYRSKAIDKKVIADISECSHLLQSASLLRQSSDILDLHETLISRLIEVPTVKSRLFPDFEGSIKSLGAWGGDFVWVLPKDVEVAKTYFNNKGFQTILDWEEMVL